MGNFYRRNVRLLIHARSLRQFGSIPKDDSSFRSVVAQHVHPVERDVALY